jgi:DNA-binding response OmpR family regulator
MKAKILIVEDDRDLGMLLKQYLELSDFTVVLCDNGKEARTCLRGEKFDIILTDIMMPVEDGFSFAEGVARQFPGLPFLFITARNLKEDIIKGLKIGADDYITKPFDAEELVLRVQNIIKRSSAHLPAVDTYLIGNYIFHPKELMLQGPLGRQVLTEREAGLLLILREQSGQLVRKKDILDRLWKGSDFFSGRSLDVFVSRLRKRLADDASIRIESIRGMGLRLMINKE